MTRLARPGRGAGAASRSGGRRRAGRLRAGLGVLALSAVLAGCTTPRNVLGPTVSRCYRAVAVARLALHGHGRFAGVRALSGTALRPVLAGYHPARDARLVLRSSTGLCVVAYRGSYEASTLGSVLEPSVAFGHLAVVVVRQRDERVIGTLVMDRASRQLQRVFPVH